MRSLYVIRHVCVSTEEHKCILGTVFHQHRYVITNCIQYGI